MAAEPTTKRGATWDRAATEAALEDAALKLLRDQGVLAGINLREVADEAGVNRGLVYHYFGNRRDLLRAALRKDVRQRLIELTADPDAAFAARSRRFIKTMIRQAEFVRLVVILALDNDPKVRILPLKDQVLPILHELKASGGLPEDLDIEAYHLLHVSMGYGYALLRESMAEEMELDLEDQDRRVAAMAERIASAIATKPRRTSSARKLTER